MREKRPQILEKVSLRALADLVAWLQIVTAVWGLTRSSSRGAVGDVVIQKASAI